MTKMHIRMRPEWNTSQSVVVGDHAIHATASPFDFPASLFIESDGKMTTISLKYDFPERESVREIFDDKCVKLFVGEKTRRVLRVEIQRGTVSKAVKAMTDAAAALRQLAADARASQQPLRQSVHFNALERALPEMGHFIEQQLQEMRDPSRSGEW